MSDMAEAPARVLDATSRVIVLLDIVRAVVTEIRSAAGVPAAIDLDAVLDRDLGLDSLARVELLLRIERAFSVRLPEDLLGTAETVRDLLSALDSVSEPRAMPEVSIVPSLPPADPAPAHVTTLVEALQWHVAAHPERTHVILSNGEYETERITYVALYDKALAIARGLQTRGIRSGDAVALMLPTGPEFLRSFFGILLAGATPVPLYPPARASQLGDHLGRQAGILASCSAQFLITVEQAKPLARLLRVKAPEVRGIATAGEIAYPGTRLEVLTGSTGVALLQYTSGSTGNPKGVVLTHDNLLANIRAMGRAVRVSPSDVFVSWLPLYHDMGLIGAWLGSLYYAMPLVLMSPMAFLQRPQRWLRTIHRYRGTLSGGPNFAYELCLKRIEDGDLTGVDLGCWRFAFNGAEPVSAETVTRFYERFRACGFDQTAMAPVYGLAESSVGLTFPPPGRTPIIDRIERRVFLSTGEALPARPADASALAFVGCGVPLEGLRVRVVNASGRPLPERHEGRIEFCGPSATRGYLNNEEETRLLFHDGWLDSGDLGYIADGELYPTSRVKDMIIRGGQNIHPYEFEEAVGRLSGIRQGCVAAFGSAKHRGGTERLVLIAETREADPARLGQLRRDINALAVDLLSVPVDEVVLAAPHTILKTSSGKIRRSATRALYERGLLGAGLQSRAVQLARFAWEGAIARLYRAARGASGLAYGAYVWILLCAFGLATTSLLVIMPRRTLRRGVARSAAKKFLALSGLQLHVVNEEHVPRAEPFILVANHASYLDGIVLLAALPVDFAFVAKRELQESAPLRFVLRAIGCVFVERFDARRGVEDVADLNRLVEGGMSLAVFPEGTFVRAPGLLPFHLGAFLVSATTRVPIVPVTLHGTRAALREGNWLPRRAAVSVTVGAALRPQGEGFGAAIALRDLARAEILRVCGEPDAMTTGAAM